jgi:hypothetical protein
MPRLERKTCQDCRRHVSECGLITHRGFCIECAKRRRAQANLEMRTHSGPTFTKWRRSMAASVGGVLVDDIIEGM